MVAPPGPSEGGETPILGAIREIPVKPVEHRVSLAPPCEIVQRAAQPIPMLASACLRLQLALKPLDRALEIRKPARRVVMHEELLPSDDQRRPVRPVRSRWQLRHLGE